MRFIPSDAENSFVFYGMLIDQFIGLFLERVECVCNMLKIWHVNG